MNGQTCVTLGVAGIAACILAACGSSNNITGNGDTGGRDSTPPTVQTVSPAAGATDVSTAASVQVTFSEPIDPTSVTATAFAVGSVSGAIDASGTNATFTPDAPLDPGASYTVTVTGVRDTAGNAMASPFTSSFTTTAPPLASNAGADQDVAFGAGAQLDGSGSARVQGFIVEQFSHAGTCTRYPEEPRLLVHHPVERRGIDPFFLEKINDDSGIKVARAGAHDEPSRRGETHGRVHALAMPDGCHACPIPQVSDDHSSGSCLFPGFLAQLLQNVLVG